MTDSAERIGDIAREGCGSERRTADTCNGECADGCRFFQIVVDCQEDLECSPAGWRHKDDCPLAGQPEGKSRRLLRGYGVHIVENGVENGVASLQAVESDRAEGIVGEFFGQRRRALHLHIRKDRHWTHGAPSF
ncbi:MAG: hypothetical protein WCE42_24270 [Rhizobium ruizarguesonis]|uniref:hypothetical protein n=1 Tax=Rhizobium ruizarguesonis TaxID=2081791 RepID=UPI001FDEC89B|nr:hypothetical protein [Rhizobium ruizarguesonis]